MQETFKWLRENSPPTSYYYTPDKPAEYGVMSWWDYGNWILYISQRPVVANNFQTGIDDAAHFLTEPDEEAANEILSKRKVRFIITDGDVEVTANIITNQGRTFVYTQRAIAKNGRYEIKVPYSTRGYKYGTKSIGDYTIQNANVSKVVLVNEQDVQEGRELEVDLI